MIAEQDMKTTDDLDPIDNITPIPTAPVGQDKLKINRSIVAGLIFLHVGALFGPFTFTWPAFWVFIFLWWLTNGFGICMGYHRLLTHRSFKCPKWFEYFITVCAILTSQGGPITWVSTHRLHHAASDKDQDPHSPTKGFWWAHMLWFVYHSPVLENPEFRQRYAADLYRDPVHRFLTKYNWAGPWILGTILFLSGGFPFLVWGIFVRTVVALHCTWLVNSAAHTWGYQTYKTGDRSTNCWWVGLLAFGEGWHNNHHAFHYSAAHGLKWWEFDLTYLMIRFLSRIGVIQSVRLPNAATAANNKLSRS